MKLTDERYVGVPWKDGGRNFAGADCVGLTSLFLHGEFGFDAPVPSSQTKSEDVEALLGKFPFDEKALKRGDVVFFRRNGKINHVAVWLGQGKLLHTFRGGPSRIENGFTLVRRTGMVPIVAVPPAEAEVLAKALTLKGLGNPVVLFIIAIALSLISGLLMPLLARKGNNYGKYSFDGLVTQNSPEIPLPDILGAVCVAGNSPYTQLADPSLAVSSQAQQAANKIVVLCGGPIDYVDTFDFNVLINGKTYNDPGFFAGNSGGIFLNPSQDKADAVSGSIGTDTYRPSMTVYPGTYGVSVPVDINASYDRTFPVYGYAGCCYMVFRLFNSSIFSQFNLNCTIYGRMCRQYNSSGFIVNTSTSDAVGTGDGSTKRFALANSDAIGISSLTVGGTSYSLIAPGNQTGNVFWLNKTKGYVEFLTAPTASAAIVATYTYYPRAWSQCPADHLVYLLTEKIRGKGFDASRIDWPRAVEFQTYCNATVNWTDAEGSTSGPRFTTNYVIDARKPIQEHIQAICDASCAYLFLSGGKFVMKARQSDSSVFSFNESNILKDSFSSTLVDRADRPNRIQLFYHNQTAYNAETEVDLDDPADQAQRAPRVGNDGVVSQTLKFPAINNQVQSEQIAQTLMRESLNSLWTCTFKTTVLGLALEPGDVIDVTHSSRPAWNQKLFRIEDLQFGDDDRLEMQLSEFFAGSYI
jgi:hypothetical protein